MCDVCHNQTDQKAGNWETVWQLTERHHTCWHMWPSATPKFSRMRYFLTLTAVPQRFRKVHLIRHRSETEEQCFNFVEWIDRNWLHRVKRFHSDNGAEFLALPKRFLQMGINFTTASVYTPQSNGVAERMNRTLIGKTKAMLQSAGMNTRFGMRRSWRWHTYKILRQYQR